jgi:hypothetical protein
MVRKALESISGSIAAMFLKDAIKKGYGLEIPSLGIKTGEIMTDIFVNDVRPDNDASLELIPKIETFQELQHAFGLDVDRSQGEQRATSGQRYWRLIGFEVRTGIAAFLTQIKDANGSPADQILVYNNWPGADSLSTPANPPYFSNAGAGFTDGSGVQGAPYSGGAVTGPNGGVYNIWPSADPAGGTRIASDMAVRLGWIGGTDHLTANPIFKDTLKGPTLPPSGDVAKLVVFDALGGRVGEVALVSGQGFGGRIALFSDGIEQSHVNLDEG